MNAKLGISTQMLSKKSYVTCSFEKNVFFFCWLVLLTFHCFFPGNAGGLVSVYKITNAQNFQNSTRNGITSNFLQGPYNAFAFHNTSYTTGIFTIALFFVSCKLMFRTQL